MWTKPHAFLPKDHLYTCFGHCVLGASSFCSPTFDHPGTATEGQAFFLLMEAAYSALEGEGK